MLKARQCLLQMRDYHSPLCSDDMDLRLDMNENTTGCSERVLARLRNLDARSLALYPRRETAEAMTATFLGVDPANILLTNGADEGIDLLCHAYLEPQDEVIIVVPAFAMYEVFAQAAGARTVRVPAGPDYRFSLQGILNALSPRTRMIIITNPNNPTGVAVERDDIMRVLEAAPDAAVLLDEAYFDFYGQTMMDQVGRIPNLFVARTFSKAYGLAGLRLGILAGAAEQMAILRRVIAPFNVNVFAVECLAEALEDQKSVAGYVRQVRSTREWLHDSLQAMGFKCWPSQANFLLVNFGELRERILEGMQERAIALRNRPDCAGCVRISIGTQAEMERVISALKEILAATPAPQQATR